jgi:MFS family permease
MPPGPSDHRVRELPQEILLGIGSVTVMAAALIASAVPATDAVARYGVLVVTVLLFTMVADVWAAAIGVAVIGYLIFDGFLVNQLGELSWHGGADTNRLAALTLAVVFGRLAASGYRAVRWRRYPTRVTQLSGHRHDAGSPR